MSVINATPLLAAAGGDYQISRSVRLRNSASAYFSRTPSTSPTSRTTNSMSMWFKRGQLGLNNDFLYGTANNYEGARFLTDDLLYCNVAGGATWITNAVYRDPSAWYHFLFVNDTTNATAGDRFRLYVNGVRQTFGTSPAITQNQQTVEWAVSGFLNTIGNQGTASRYFDGYMTEVNFIDGQALTPSSFGETDSITGVWKPKKYAGTYGTNGFYLNFSDNSAATATTIGKDYSGNGNNWTPNNISVTAGVTYDSMLDVPTLYADRGNYCVMNPLINTAGYVTIAQGNLYASIGAADKIAHATMQLPSTGKWYWEYTATSAGSQSAQGVSNNAVTQSSGAGFSTANLRMYQINGQKTNGTASAAYGASFTTNDVIGVAVDMDAGTIVFYKNNTSQGTAYSDLAGGTWFPATYINSANGHFNFGQRPFAYTPPTGFKALNTQNLPEPTIKKGNQYFDATTYTGNGSTQSIVNSGGMQPDLVWAKNRATTTWNSLQDVIRGATKELYSNATDAEATYTNTLTSFNSNGFSVGNAAAWNGSGNGIVAWQWKESPSAGFDIVTYTGTGVARTVAHSLGVKPSMMIVKNRSSGTTGWAAYHSALGATKVLELNTTSAAVTASGEWNNTEPTSSVFTVGTSSWTNNNTNSIVAYLFAEVAGFSKFGSYTGNGSADGPFVFTGFRPRWVMIKRTDTAGNNWSILDTSRSTANAASSFLYPNSSSAEVTVTAPPGIDFLSNGFKLRSTDAADNASGSTYIFACFAENPFKNSLAR